MRFPFLFAIVAPLLMLRSVQAEFVEWSVVEFVDIDLHELNKVRNNFGGNGPGDFDGSGLVDLEDLNYVRNNFGTSPVLFFDSLTPANPKADDVIDFTLVYGFGGDICHAQQVTGGAPILVINHAQATIEVAFDPNSEPIICAGDSPHVQGVAGEFGPLAAGNWTLGIAGEAPRIAFHVSEAAAAPEPSALALTLIAGLGSVAAGSRRRRRA
jgi:hypothetical protein